VTLLPAWAPGRGNKAIIFSFSAIDREGRKKRKEKKDKMAEKIRYKNIF
jgi:hypothetical protein